MQTLQGYLAACLDNKPRATRELITNAQIERQTALQKWQARDWETYHRAYYKSN